MTKGEPAPGSGSDWARLLLVAVVALVVIQSACFDDTSTGPSEPAGPACPTEPYGYCGNISMNITMVSDCQGFGYYSRGTVTLHFNPQTYSSNTYVFLNLNGQSIIGAANIPSGYSDYKIDIRGSSVACPYKNPSSLAVCTDSSCSLAFAIINFNWERTGCQSCT